MKSILRKFLNIVFPRTCLGCGQIGSYLCDNCIRQRVKINWVQRCPVCGSECRVGMVHKECEELTYLDGLVFIALYDGVIKNLLFKIKYKFMYDMLEDIGMMMSKFLKFYPQFKESVLSSVPLHVRKKNLRGFNQAEVLGRFIADQVGIEYIELLRRVRNTKTQVQLSKNEREVNLKEAFEFTNVANPKSVVIVDDVFTTGTTLNECAKVLKENGVEKVYGYTFAKSRL